MSGATHAFPVRVYFEDTDFSGSVYHAAYLKFFERGRTEFLRALGVHHHELQRQGLVFAVSRLEIDYVRPAGIDDLLSVTTAPTTMTGARMVLSQTLDRDGVTVSRALVTAVLLNAAGRPVRFPQALLERLSGG